jgi:hypothetical protein
VKKPFLITIDTEGDNLWSRHEGPPTTKNARYLPRFQALCDRYGLKPTYLVNYEMSQDGFMVEFGRDVIRRGVGEIGSHPHPWDSPPKHPLTENDQKYHPFMIEYPESVAREKLAVLTDQLEEGFQVKMVSHRAGRWAFNSAYARLLMERGYRVDCSVTPHVSWVLSSGHPDGPGGSDYRSFPDRAYYVDPNNIARSGQSSLLEVPMTIRPRYARALRKWMPHALHQRAFTQRWLSRLWPLVWLRPMGGNLRDLLWLLNTSHREDAPYVEFMLHSSELMPGGSPTFTNDQAIERLYDDMTQLFDRAAQIYGGCTLGQYADDFSNEKK